LGFKVLGVGSRVHCFVVSVRLPVLETNKRAEYNTSSEVTPQMSRVPSMCTKSAGADW